MKKIIAFVKKECLEQARTGRMTLLLIVFFLLGLMNPAMAKLTPKIMGLLEDEMQEAGLSILETEVTALTSWNQFYKNLSIPFIMFFILFAGIMTNEFARGTLINMLTKGISRTQVFFAKFLTVAMLWTVSYAVFCGTSLLYTLFIWDNSSLENVPAALLMPYVLGLTFTGFLMFFSSFAENTTGVMGMLAGITILMILIGIVPKAYNYLPTKLMSSLTLMTGDEELKDFLAPLLISAAAFVLSLTGGAVLFSKHKI